MHWTMGGAVLGCVAFIKLVQNTKDPKEKVKYMFWHKSCGTLAAGLLVPRLAIRAMTKTPPEFSKVLWEKTAAKLGHYALYGYLAFMPLSGVAMGYYGGKGLPFFFTTIPGAKETNGANAKFAYQWHKKLGWYLDFVILGHIGGAAYHTAMGHKILPRIVPGLK
jgi:1,2-dihydroxy-3-keto-5-methylthiopentene dioxygenase